MKIRFTSGYLQHHWNDLNHQNTSYSGHQENTRFLKNIQTCFSSRFASNFVASDVISVDVIKNMTSVILTDSNVRFSFPDLWFHFRSFEKLILPKEKYVQGPHSSSNRKYIRSKIIWIWNRKSLTIPRLFIDPIYFWAKRRSRTYHFKIFLFKSKSIQKIGSRHFLVTWKSDLHPHIKMLLVSQFELLDFLIFLSST